jgi:uncharacterized protein involved in cysteine biosynthesis
MSAILQTLGRATRDILTPRMLALAIWPMLVSLIVWGILAWWFGAAWKAEINALLGGTPVARLAHWLGADWLTGYAAGLLLALIWLPAVYLTALMITSLALMSIIVDFIAARHYPHLERRRGGNLVGSLTNSLGGLSWYLLLWILLLPAWLFAPFGAILSLLLTAWLNQKLFRYDALAEHASTAELKQLRQTGGWRLFPLSGLLVLLHLVPIVNLLAPVYMGLAFTHHSLAALAHIRSRAPA